MACLDRETAMSYLRGDLEPEDAERWSAHLTTCETCRQRLQEVSELVDDVRQELMLADIDTGGDWRRLERLIELASARPSARRFSWFTPRAVAAVAASLLVAAGIFWSRGTSLSAAEVLGRATLAEHALDQESGKVLHRVLTIEERRGRERTLVSRRRVEGWRKVGTRVSARRAFDEAGQLCAAEWIDANGTRTVRARAEPERRTESSPPVEYLTAGQPWQVELSATVFSTLLPSPDAARVTKSAEAISIRYESDAQGPVTAATLTLSAAGLHAIEQTIQIGHGDSRREYRFVEDRVIVLSANAISPAIFEPEAGAPDGRAEVAPPPSPRPRALGLERLLGLEIEALRLLDSAGALLGEQVTVSRTPGAIRIQALVDSEQRKQQLERAVEPLSRARGVEVDIQTFAVAAQQQPDAASSLTFRQVDIPAGDIPVGPQLRRYLAAGADRPATAEIEEEVRAFASQVVEHSRLIVQHAWAMKRVQSRYSSQELARLGMNARATWRRIVSEHSLQVIEHAEALRASLQRVFFTGQDAAPGGMSPGGGASDEPGALIERLLDLAHTQDEAVRAAFSASSAAGSSATFITTTRFFDRLDELISIAQRVDAGR